MYPDTGKTIAKYKEIANDAHNPELRETQRTASGKEVSRLEQEDTKKRQKVKNPCTQ